MLDDKTIYIQVRMKNGKIPKYQKIPKQGYAFSRIRVTESITLCELSP